MGTTGTIQPIVLQRHHAGRTVDPRDLETIQDYIQDALHSLQATKIVSSQLAHGAIGSQHITAGSIAVNAQLASGVILDKNVAANAALNGQKLAAGSVLSTQIGNNAIVEGNIAVGTITNQSISNTANINGSKLAATSVTDTQLASGISAAKISGALSAASIAATAITAGALSSSVTINDANWSGTALSDAHLGTGLTASKISGALSNATIGATAVTAGALGSSVTINNANWSGTALSDANLGTGLTASKISGALSNATIAGGAVTGTGVLNLAVLASGALASGVTVNNNNWSGAGITGSHIAANTVAESNVVAGTLTTASISSSANITGGQIAASTLHESNVAAGTLTVQSINSAANIFGSMLLSGSVRSDRMAKHTITNNEVQPGTITAFHVANVNTQPLANNAILYSEQFDNGSGWTPTGVVVAAPTVTANATTSPTGTTTAEKIVYPAVTATGNGTYVSQPYVLTSTQITAAGSSFVLSVWLKGNAGGETIWLSTTPDGVTYYTARCVCTTSWQRFNVVATCSATTWYYVLGIDQRDTNQQFSSSAQTVFAWGAQLEQASVVGPYAPTTSAAVAGVTSTAPQVTGLTEAHIASIDASVATLTNLNATNISTGSLNLARLASGALASGVTVNNANWSGTALAFSNLATGALPSGVTINNSNWSGTALALTNLASGALASGITVNNSNWSGTALALANIATGALPSGITINNANWSGTALALSNLAAGALASTITVNNNNWSGAGLTGTNIASHTVAESNIVAGTLTTASLSASAGVKGSQLESFMKAGCKYEATTDYYIISGPPVVNAVATNASPIPFGTQDFDGQAQWSGVPKGYNLCLQSEAFDNASWTKTGITSAAPTVTANTTTSPSGTSTADQIAYPAVNAGNTSIVGQAITLPSADTYAFSVWMKTNSGTATVYMMAFNGSTYASAACSITTTWQRFLILGNYTAASWTFAIGVDLRDGTQATKAAQTIVAWGAQVEEAPWWGPYVPTTTTAVTTGTNSTWPSPNYTTFTPVATGTYNVRARVRLLGGGITPGVGGILLLWDNTSNALVAQGPNCPSFTDPQANGSVASADVIDATIDEALTLNSAHTYSLFYFIPTKWHANISEFGGGDWTAASAIVKAAQLDKTTVYKLPGAWVSVYPVAQ